MPVYVLDTNFFIQSHANLYPPDVVPGFWNKIRELSHNGDVVSIDKVKDELYKYDGNLKNWCVNNLPDTFFCDTKQVVDSYGSVVNWAQSRADHYLPKALAEFMTIHIADAWLVSYAKSHDVKIVTYEVGDRQRKNKIKIPDACLPFGITCINPVKMFRELGQTM